jgi:hypothetical protein
MFTAIPMDIDKQYDELTGVFVSVFSLAHNPAAFMADLHALVSHVMLQTYTTLRELERQNITTLSYVLSRVNKSEPDVISYVQELRLAKIEELELIEILQMQQQRNLNMLSHSMWMQIYVQVRSYGE